MWSPSPPFIVLQFSTGWENVLEVQRDFETRHATGVFPWCFVPMLSHTNLVPAKILSHEEAKKHLLQRSVFDVVKSTPFLELTDTKLLGWYLCLPAEDRKIIQEEGGLLQFLQKHPALDVTRNFVYVKGRSVEECAVPLSSAMSSDLNKSRRPTYYGVSLCKSCGASIPFNTKSCRLCCVPTKKPDKLHLPDQGRELGLLPSSVKEELNFCPGGGVGGPGERRLARGPADESLDLVTEESFCSAAEGPPGQQGAHVLSRLWDEQVESKSAAVTVYKDQSAQASFALDAQLERHGKTPQGVVGSRGRGGYGGEETADLEMEVLPEYCSFDSTGLDASYRDCSDTSQSGSSYPSELDPAAESRVPEEAGSCGSADSVPCRGDPEEDSRFGLKDEEFHSVMEEEPLEVSGAIWVSSWTPRPHGAEMDPRLSPGPADQSGGSPSGVGARRWAGPEHGFAPSPPSSGGRDSSLAVLYDSRSLAESPRDSVSQSVDVSGDFRASYTSTRSTEAQWSTTSRASSTELPHAAKNTAVNAGTQTESAPTADKHVITELCMTDLDYFTEEFIKLQHAEDELKELKAKFACPEAGVADAGSRRGRECDCSQRAVRAELRLLALQYAMCLQHCWRRYYTSPVGDRCMLSMEGPSENIENILQELEEDYCEMKRKILSGVLLDQLQPLSVNSQRIGSEVLYIPAQILKDCLSEDEGPGVQQGGAPEPEPGPQDRGEEGGGGHLACNSAESLQTDQTEAPAAVKPKPDSSKSGAADTPLPPQVAPSGRPTTSLPVGHRPGGAKDSESSEAWYDAEEEFGPVCKGQKGPQSEAEDAGSDGTASKGKKDLNCFLCVTGLPSDVTEDEVRSCFREYQVSEIKITIFSNEFRVAMMSIGCPKLARAAVREVNGRTMRGHVVKVTSVCRPGNPSPERPGGRAKTNRAGRLVNVQGPKNSKSSLSVTAKPLQHRLEKLTNVQDTPTASGTCVPQHYATMGSFDTLMARLTERHPQAGRERIVRALVELREQNQGLSGLPLRTIVDMTSDLLTRPPRVA